MQRYVVIAEEELSTGEFASAMHQSILPIEPISVIICGTMNSVFFKVSLFQLLLKLLDRYITMPNANFNGCPREGPSQLVHVTITLARFFSTGMCSFRCDRFFYSGRCSPATWLGVGGIQVAMLHGYARTNN